MCHPEMRKDRIYNLLMSIDQNCYDIMATSCDCPAGKGPYQQHQENTKISNMQTAGVDLGFSERGLNIEVISKVGGVGAQPPRSYRVFY